MEEMAEATAAETVVCRQPYSRVLVNFDNKFCSRCFKFLRSHPTIDDSLTTKWDLSSFPKLEGFDKGRFLRCTYEISLGRIRESRKTCELCKMFFRVHHNYAIMGCFGSGSGEVDWRRTRVFELRYCIKSGAEKLDIEQIRVQEMTRGLRLQKSMHLYICAYPGELSVHTLAFIYSILCRGHCSPIRKQQTNSVRPLNG